LESGWIGHLKFKSSNQKSRLYQGHDWASWCSVWSQALSENGCGFSKKEAQDWGWGYGGWWFSCVWLVTGMKKAFGSRFHKSTEMGFSPEHA
jgi:hypothetical protein